MEKFLYMVNPRIPIKGLEPTAIRRSKNIDLDKEQVKFCLKHGPVFRKFDANNMVKVTLFNLDRLHQATYVEEETPVVETVEVAPVVEHIVAEPVVEMSVEEEVVEEVLTAETVEEAAEEVEETVEEKGFETVEITVEEAAEEVSKDAAEDPTILPERKNHYVNNNSNRKKKNK